MLKLPIARSQENPDNAQRERSETSSRLSAIHGKNKPKANGWRFGVNNSRAARLIDCKGFPPA
jgi:hypothetical protein